MTSLATKLATPTVTDRRTDTLPRLIYKDVGLELNARLTELLSYVVPCSIMYSCTILEQFHRSPPGLGLVSLGPFYCA